MKKILLIIITACLVLSLFSCKKQDKNPVSTTAADAEVTDYMNNLKDDDPLPITEYVYKDYSDFLEVGEIDSIKCNIEDVNNAVEEYRQEVLESFKGSFFVSTEEGYEAQNGDMVTVFYTGYSADEEVVISEETLANMTNKGDEQGYDLILGEGRFIGEYKSEEHPEKNNPGFEEQLIGTKAGDKKTIKVTFPDSYSEELGGAVIFFDVEIEKIQQCNDPTELTDELVTEYTQGEITSVVGLTEYLTGHYKGEIAYNAVISQINVKKYPDGTVEKYVDEYLKAYLMSYYGEDATEEDAGEEEVKTIREEGKEQGENYISQRLKWNYLFDKYGITLTKGEYYSLLKENFNQYSDYYYYYYGVSNIEEFEEIFEREYLISEFMSRKLSEKLATAVEWTEN